MRGKSQALRALAPLLVAATVFGGPAAAQEEDAVPLPPAAPGERSDARPPEPGEIEGLIRALGASGYAERERATDRLIEIGKPAHEALRAALASDDAEVRYRARLVLRAGLRRVTALLERLTSRGRNAAGDEDPFVALVEMGADAVDHLAFLLRRDLQDYQGEDERLRVTIQALGAIASKLAEAGDERARSARDALLAVLDLNLRDQFPNDLAAALRPQAKDARAALAARLRDREPLVRQNAVRVLGLLGEGEAGGGADETILALASALDDRDPTVRIEAIRGVAAAGRGPPVRACAGEAILRALEDKDRTVETAAIRALAELREKRAIPHLRGIVGPAGAAAARAQASGDPAGAVPGGDDDRIAAAIEGLGLLGDRDAIPAIVPFLRSPSGGLAGAAADALGQLDAEEAVPDLVALLQREDMAALPKAIAALGRIGRPAALEPLKAFYRSRNIFRPKALVAIGKIDSPEAAAFLLERARQSEDEGEVRSALEALSRRADSGEAKARADLGDAAVAALGRQPRSLRLEALRLIARARHGPAYEKVIALAGSGDEQLAAQAIETLGAIGDRRAVGPLKAILERPAAGEDLRRAVARTLGRLGEPEALRASIAASEAKVAASPDDEDERFQLGLDYLYAKENAKGAAIFEELLARDPRNAIAAYNLACGKSLLGETEAALAALKKSIELGFREWRHMDQDSDLDPLRQNEEFKRIMSDLRRRPSRFSRGGAVIILERGQPIILDGDGGDE